jgi:hypothetical protein
MYTVCIYIYTYTYIYMYIYYNNSQKDGEVNNVEVSSKDCIIYTILETRLLYYMTVWLVVSNTW